MKKYILLLIILFFSLDVSAAILKGNIYDFGLEEKTNVIVSIDSVPKQAIISIDGSYDFTVPLGNYTVKADYYENQMLGLTATDTIIITDAQGEYTLDLILLPAIQDEMDEFNFDIEELTSTKSFFDVRYLLYVVIIVLLVAIVFLYKSYKKKNNTVLYTIDQPVQTSVSIDMGANTKVTHVTEPEFITKEPDKKKEQPQEVTYHDKLVSQVLKVLKENGGSLTQKDIRKNFTSSEAKISLVLAELEHKGQIEKIKKGRGNIIVLKSGDKDKVHREDTQINREEGSSNHSSD